MIDRISRLRLKNLLLNMLEFCEKAEEIEEKKVLFRIGVVTLNKLRVHATVDPFLGQDVRDFNSKILSSPEEDILNIAWDEMLDLLFSYKKSLS